MRQAVEIRKSYNRPLLVRQFTKRAVYRRVHVPAWLARLIRFGGIDVRFIMTGVCESPRSHRATTLCTQHVDGAIARHPQHPRHDADARVFERRAFVPHLPKRSITTSSASAVLRRMFSATPSSHGVAWSIGSTSARSSRAISRCRSVSSRAICRCRVATPVAARTMLTDARACQTVRCRPPC